MEFYESTILAIRQSVPLLHYQELMYQHRDILLDPFSCTQPGETLYYLQSLRELILLLDGGAGVSLEQLSMEFLQQLLQASLIPHLLQGIDKAQEQASPTTSDSISGVSEAVREKRYHHLVECITASECILYLILVLPFRTCAELDGLVRALEKAQTRAETIEKMSKRNGEVPPLIWESRVLLMSALLHCINTCFSLEDRRDHTTLLSNTKDVKALDGLLYEGQAPRGDSYLYPVQLSWLVMLQRNEDLCTLLGADISARFTAISGAFGFLHDLLSNPSLGVYGENWRYVGLVLDTLLKGVLVSLSPHIRQLKMNQEYAYEASLDDISKADMLLTGGRKPTPAPSNTITKSYFDKLLLLVAKLCEMVPERNMDFWEGSEESCTDEEKVLLYKFLLFAGYNMLDYLFVPFMTMLAALARGPKASLSAYEFLKDFDVSFDQIFSSLGSYVIQVLPESPHVDQSRYSYEVVRHESARKAPLGEAEVLDIIAVLHIIEAVLAHNAGIRLGLCNHPQYHALDTMVRIISCPVPHRVKVRALYCLANASRSPELAERVLPMLEASLILPLSASDAGGMRYELRARTSQAASYTDVAALLAVLQEVARNVSMPALRRVGMGSRPPGFWNYLEFALSDVMSRIIHRSFASERHRWQLASGALGMIVHTLSRYAPCDLEDVEASRFEGVSGLSVGGYIMHYFLSHPSLLQVLIVIIGRGEALSGLSTVSAAEYDEEVALVLSLKCLYLILAKTPLYLREHRRRLAPDPYVSVPGLLLQGGPERGGRKEHIVAIAGLVRYQHCPSVRYYAMKVVGAVCASEANHYRVLSTGPFREATLSAYAAALSASIPWDYAEAKKAPPPGSIDWSDLPGYSSNEVAKEVLLGLLEVLQSRAPQLALFLLGVDSCEDATFIASPLLTAVVDLAGLRRDILSPLAMQVIYMLCMERRCAKRILDALLANQFFHSRMEGLVRPRDAGGLMADDEWVVRLIGLALFYHGSVEQRRALLAPLLTQAIVGKEGGEDLNRRWNPEASGRGAAQQRSVLIELLDRVAWTVDPPPTIEGTSWCPAAQMVACRTIKERNAWLFDVEMLYEVLVAQSQRTMGGGLLTTAQAAARERQIKEILETVVRYNNRVQAHEENVQFYDACRQLIGVICGQCQQLVIDEFGPGTFHDTAEVLLGKIRLDGVGQQLAERVCESVLLLVSALCRVGSQGEDEVDPGCILLQGVVQAIFIHESTGYGRGNLYIALVALLAHGDEQTQAQRILSTYGARLVAALGHDSTYAEDAWKAAAFTCLETVLRYDQGVWTRELAMRGYLEEYITLCAQPFQAKDGTGFSRGALFVHQARCGLLQRIAQSPSGAQRFVDLGLVQKFIESDLFDRRPITDDHSSQSGLSVYYLAVFPIYELLVTLASHGLDVGGIQGQLTNFLSAHAELLFVVLGWDARKGSMLSLNRMMELDLVTSLVMHVATGRGDQVQRRAQRMTGLMLGLMVRLEGDGPLAGYNCVEEEKDTLALLIARIRRNCLIYCQRMSEESTVLFAPKMNVMRVDSAGQRGLSVLSDAHPHMDILVTYILMLWTDYRRTQSSIDLDAKIGEATVERMKILTHSLEASLLILLRHLEAFLGEGRSTLVDIIAKVTEALALQLTVMAKELGSAENEFIYICIRKVEDILHPFQSQ